MKILGRILLILVVAMFIGSVFYIGVNTAGRIVSPRLRSTGEQIRHEDDFEVGSRPDFGAGPHEREEERASGGRLILGMIKNALVVAFVVTVFILPASLSKKKRLSLSSIHSDPSA